MHRYWVHPRNQKRREQGDFYNLVAELRLDKDRHYQYFRMSAEQMDEILSMVGPELTKQSTNYRAAIEPKQRLAVALRYLASGDSMVSLASSYRMGRSTVILTLRMLCAAVEKCMREKFLPKATEDTWRQVAQTFWDRWNFPNCLGALDGKHIDVRVPSRPGNSKKDVSLVLLALVDADYRFRVVEVGDFGETGDAALYARSELGVAMESGTLDVPAGTALPGATQLGDAPFVVVADAAFPLKPHLMRPYPGRTLSKPKRIFNYRLSRARAAVDTAFGILGSRWRVLQRKVNLHPDRVEALMTALCILHNFLLAPSSNQRLLDEAARRRWRCLVSVGNMGGNRASREAYNVRERYTTFFNSPAGSVSWQDKMVGHD